MAKKSNPGLSPGIIVLIVIVAVVVLGFLWVWGTYNSLVSLDENSKQKWADVQSSYQRRADLVPNLVATVQGAATFEQSTQTKIAEVRSGAVAAQVAMKAAQTPEQVQAAAAQVDASLAAFRSLNINVENYPQLKATENFLSLQDELAGTENRINVARNAFNDAVRAFNIRVRSFPTVVLAGMFGFSQKEMFQASEGAETAPVVKF